MRGILVKRKDFWGVYNLNGREMLKPDKYTGKIRLYHYPIFTNDNSYNYYYSPKDGKTYFNIETGQSLRG